MAQTIIPAGKLSDLSGLAESDRNEAIVKTVLGLRGITDIENFLNPAKIDTNFFNTIKKIFGTSLGQAVQIVTQFCADNPKGSIVIHGDYDVDGVSATAILWEELYYDYGYKNTMPFIPHRVNHGYGLSKESIDDIGKTLAEKNIAPGILITVDCGVTAKMAVAYAKEKGFTVIVTDHHTLPTDETDLPDAAAILHTYDLCGAGIAWVLARALQEAKDEAKFDDQALTTGIDLVALATLSDLQSLTKFNRSLVRAGLAELSDTKRAGLRTMYEISGIIEKKITPYEVGWIIAPRLNATGRLEHALDALRLLVARGESQARELAQKLETLNQTRQGLTETAIRQATEMVEKAWNKKSPIIVASNDWHEGVIGLIAGKLVEKYQVPVVAVALSGEKAKGSARSIEGINIVTILRQFGDLFESVGGHAQAAGFSLSLEKVDLLKEKIAKYELEAVDLDEAYSVDLELNPVWLTWDLYQALSGLEPYGIGNPKPVFVSFNLPVESARVVGKTGSHLSVTFTNGLRGIGFNLGDKLGQIEGKEQVTVAYALDKDDYRGMGSVQVVIKALF